MGPGPQDRLLHHPRSRGGALPRRSRGDHDDAPLPGEADPRRRFRAPAELPRALVAALPRAQIARLRRGPRGSDEGVRGRRTGARVINVVKLRKAVFSRATARGIASVAIVLAIWELGRRFSVPFLAAVPAPT